MKKTAGCCLALALIVVLAVPSFAAANTNPKEEEVLYEYDLTKITQEQEVIYSDITPDYVIKVTATKPTYRGTSGETSVTTTVLTWDLDLLFILETDYWFNANLNQTGYSSASTSYDISPDNTLLNYSISSPSGTQPAVTIGDHWTKVEADWMYTTRIGSGSTGTLWNKITSKGKLSASN